MLRDIQFEYFIIFLDLNPPSVTKTLVVIHVLGKQMLKPPVFSFASVAYGFHPIVQVNWHKFLHTGVKKVACYVHLQNEQKTVVTPSNHTNIHSSLFLCLKKKTPTFLGEKPSPC